MRKDAASLIARDEAGLATVEYVIVLVLIAAVGVTTWQKFGSSVERWLGRAHNEIRDNLTVGKD